jgi:tetratricopeptide (TPR) repeat protein
MILGACSALTWRQCALWRDSETIYTSSLARAGESWKNLYELALLRSAEGRIDEALGLFERAVRVNPENPHLRRNLGVLLQQRGRRAEAIEHFEEAVRASPSYVRGHFALGLAYAAEGRLAEGSVELAEAVRLDPSFAEGQLELGRVLRQVGRPQEALAAFERAAGLRPQWAPPLAAMAEMLAASPAPAIRDPPRALELALRAASLEGGDEPFVLMALAGAYHANGRTGEAIATAVRAERRAIEKSQPVLARRIADEIARYRGGS